MSWHPNDLVSDRDLVAYEMDILDRFGATTWIDKRTKALEDWAFPILAGAGFDPYQLRTRHDANQVWQFTGAVYTDLNDSATDATDDDIDLAAVFATPGTDALFVGSDEHFFGLHLRILDSPSSTTSTMTVSYWAGLWQELTIYDGTVSAATTSQTLSQGGSVTWAIPPDWERRPVNGSDRLYWARVQVSATPTGATAGQIATIRASRLRAAVTFRTLHLIFVEAPTGQEGPWADKAEFYERQADISMQRALPLIGGEFDTDDSDQISATEDDATAEQVGGGGFSLERA